MTTKLVIASHKGGTGKTTTAVTVGHRLAKLGYKTLLVDFDPQGNLADYLGLDPGPGVYQLLLKREPLSGVAVPTGRDNLDLVTSNHTTARAAKELISETGRDERLKRALRNTPYDWVIIDTAPSLGLLQTLAFIASDLLLVPSELTFASGLGVAQVLRTVAAVKEDIDTPIRLAGILPTKWDRRVGENETQLKALSSRFPKSVWLPIPTDSKVSEAPAFGATLWEYAPSCPALKGRAVGGQLIGGYEQAIARLMKEARP